mgnify:CR=1 FL=1
MVYFSIESYKVYQSQIKAVPKIRSHKRQIEGKGILTLILVTKTNKDKDQRIGMKNIFRKSQADLV